MTREEKARAYDEALERARKMLNMILDNELLGFPDQIREIFPQLHESEDERIRKLLIWQVHRNIEDETNDLAQSVYDGIKGHDPDLEESIEDWKKCLAYLEKQKEQKPKAKAKSPLSPHELYDAKIEGISQGRQDVLDHPEQFGLQKPAEWSEEDERKYQCIRNILLTDMGKKVGSWKYSEILEWYEKRGIGRYTSFKSRWKPSKDEERLINTSISFLKDFADKGYENAVECIDWLKSKLNGNSGK